MDIVISGFMLDIIMDKIPAFFVTSSDGILYSTRGWFDGATPVVTDDRKPLTQATEPLPRGDARTDVVICDVASLSKGCLIPDVLKKMRIRGSNIWLLTWIEDADDLFDAFNTTAETVIGPYHASSSDGSLDDILSVSDCYIPAVFSKDGMALSRNGRCEDLHRIVEKLFSMGFMDVIVVDTDGLLGRDGYQLMSERVIVFTEYAPETDTDRRMIIPFRSA